jgi:ribosomal-protein-alanine N-acetyltransferase
MGGLVDAGGLHAASLAAIHEDAFPPAERWDATAIATLLGQAGVFGLLDPRGGMILIRHVADESEVLTLAVAPQARRCGIGSALLAAAIHRAATLGARTMFLEVAERNLVARRLYERAGFTRVGMRRGYYADGASALVLRRSLAFVTDAV